MNRTGRIAAWSIAGVVAIGGAAGVAYAATPSDPALAEPVTAALQTMMVDNAPAASPENARDARRGLHRFGARGLHGEFVVQTKEGATKTVAVQRGEITAVDADSVTVKSTDGFEQTWALTENTRVRKNGETADAAALAVGDWVGAIGEKSDETLSAAGIRVPKERPDKASPPTPSQESSPSDESEPSGSLGRPGGRDTADEIAFLTSAAAKA